MDRFEPRIRKLLRAVPTMPATVITERVGWPCGIRTLSGRVAERRPAYLPPDPGEDLFAGWWQLVAGLGAVPRDVGFWDRKGGIGRWRGRRMGLTRQESRTSDHK